MTKQFLKLFFIGLLYFAGAGAGAGEPSPDPTGYWQGKITYREADLPFRLNIQKEKAGLAALLDIPSLVYAGQAIPIKQTGPDAFILTFPFGIGEFEWSPGGWIEKESPISLTLVRGTPPPYRKIQISFGAFEPEISGTVYMPQGDGPFPAVVLIAGSGQANRSQWTYASWADYYARLGYAAFVYDRRPEFTNLPNGQLMDFYDHGRDLAAAVDKLNSLPGIDPSKIGVSAHSRGTWIAQALNEFVPDLAFMIFISPAISTPGEQAVESNLTGMAQDGLDAADMAAARTYLRLYFYVAETGKGWDLLQAAMKEAENTPWFQYVDQPTALEDLKWWQVHMNFSSRDKLQKLTVPVLALWGEDDFIAPWVAYQGKFTSDLEMAGNKNFTSMIFEGADHRLEVNPHVDSGGAWHWFGMAPGVLEQIRDWLGLILAQN